MSDKEYLHHVYRSLSNLMETILEHDDQDFNTAANRSVNFLNMLDEERLNRIDPSDFLTRDVKKCAVLAVCLAGDDSNARSLYEDYMIAINKRAEDMD